MMVEARTILSTMEAGSRWTRSVRTATPRGCSSESTMSDQRTLGHMLASPTIVLGRSKQMFSFRVNIGYKTSNIAFSLFNLSIHIKPFERLTIQKSIFFKKLQKKSILLWVWIKDANTIVHFLEIIPKLHLSFPVMFSSYLFIFYFQKWNWSRAPNIPTLAMRWDPLAAVSCWRQFIRKSAP